MKIAMLSPIAWRTPPRHYGPWENVVSLLTEELVRQGQDVTLFATADSITSATLQAICPSPYEETPDMDAKVWEGLHIAHLFEQANQFDIIHNHFDFLPLTYTRLVKTPVVTTIHGFSSPKIVPVFQRYQDRSQYVAISQADRSPDLSYIATIHHGIDISQFSFVDTPGEYLVFMGRMHPDKGPAEAIQIARRAGLKLIMAGIIQDQAYFDTQVKPHIDGQNVDYIGTVNPDQRNQLLANALAMLHPIAFAEPFGLSVIESQACGTPVIAFNKGSMPEVIKPSQTGFIVDTVEQAVASLNQVQSINRAECRAWVEDNFTQAVMARKYIDVYQQIVSAQKAA